MPLTISASIVLYRSKREYAEKVIQDFLASPLADALFLIDNSPTDALRYLASIDARIKYQWQPQNIGFGRGHNIAINKVLGKSKYHLVLNPDIEFGSHVIPALFSFMETNKDVGNVIPKVHYKTGEVQPLCKLLPTPFALFARRFARYSFFTRRLNRRYELQHFRYNHILEVPNMSGCFMFLRNEVLQKTGGFDEHFFMYLEDVDLNRRIGSISKTVVFPDVNITHHFRKGSYQEFPLLKHHINSAIKYFNKWGWFFDKERVERNNATIRKIKQLNEANALM